MTENVLKENEVTENFSKRVFGFWLLGSAMLVVVAQVLRVVILDSELNTFLNDKFAFSLSIPTYISYTLYVIVFFLIARYLILNWLEIDKKLKIGLLLILSGGISNLLERLWYGHVVDYIYISNGVLNIADFYIILGMIIVFISRPHKH